MDWGALVGPAVVAAVVSGVISVVGMFVSRATTVRLHSEKLDTDRALAERKVQADIDLAREKFDYDRRQAVFRRRFELAEKLLADVYRFRSMMRFVRSGVSFDLGVHTTVCKCASVRPDRQAAREEADLTTRTGGSARRDCASCCSKSVTIG